MMALFIVYIGQYPWYFPYFLHSCRHNPTVDFLIFTDNQTPLKHLPPNVHLIPCSIEQFKANAFSALGFEVAVESGYKLCDFKPAYGYIFKDYIQDYDFWGYCDIDVIFGNIRDFMTNELLNEYDIISARHDYLTGCFALYRNNSLMRELFKQSKGYQKVFTDPRNFFFDETNFAFEAFEKGLHYSQIPTEVESMTHVVRRLQNFPENEYGILRGVVSNISLVPVQAGEMAYYSVEIRLADHLITTYKKELPWLPNMQGQADIITEDISLLERLVLPVKKILKESM